jgi:hypothetical protein
MCALEEGPIDRHRLTKVEKKISVCLLLFRASGFACCIEGEAILQGEACEKRNSKVNENCWWREK